MPNVTSVWDFSPGETLTAAKLDDVNCGIHVFSGTATRDAAYGGSGERALSEGEFAYLADTNTTQYYDGAAWQTVGGGLTLIKTQTIGSAVSSVTVSDVFSATYDNYRITIGGGSASTDLILNWTLGATATGYYWSGNGRIFNSTDASATEANSTAWKFQYVAPATLNATVDIFSPFLSDETTFSSQHVQAKTTGQQWQSGGYLNNTTSYTAFTITCSTGTITGGTIRVYGYQNS